MKRMIVAGLILGVLAFGTRGWFTEANADASTLPFKARAMAMARDADAPPAPTATPTLTPTPGATATPSPTSAATPTPTPTGTPATPTATPSPTSTPAAVVTFGEGTYKVGTDLQAGTYRTRSDASGCYWARLSGFGGTLDEIITNDLDNYPMVVTISPSDAGFMTRRCATWTNDLSAITSSQTASFDNGTFLVGTDIAAGTWQAPGGSSCYWARESGFSGKLADIITNHFGSGSQIVTIAASDKGFKTHNCGTWTRS